jgi:PEP-CTERM motif
MRIAPPFLMLVPALTLSLYSAKADTIDPASYSIQFEGVPGAVSATGSTAQSGSYSFSGGTINVSATAATTSQPEASADVSSSGCGCDSIYNVTSIIDYYFEVSGPPDVLIPVTLDIAGWTMITGVYGGYEQALAGVSIISPSKSVIAVATLPYQASGVCGSDCLYGAEFVVIPSDTQYKVELTAYSSANNYNVLASSATSWLDSYVYIDPNLAGSQFSLLISPGVGNSPVFSLPEPSTWAMMLIGFAGLGFLGYRARRTARPAQAFASLRITSL